MILIAILGLILPGYALAGGRREPAAWAAAFPFSALLLTETVIVFAILGVPVRFVAVLAALAVETLAALAVAWLPGKDSTTLDPDPQPAAAVPRWFALIVATQVALVLCGLLLRTSLYPLSGFDTVFRWEALARVMLEEGGLAHYPPVSAEDFSIYTYPDGIPPLTATVYWWLYAAWGAPAPQLTSIAIVLQVASLLALVFCAARTMAGLAGGLLAALALSSTTLLLRAVDIGQETGYTAIAVAGQFAFAIAATRAPQMRLVVLAALSAGLGALAREYGIALGLCGFIVLLLDRSTRRYLPLYCLVAAACAAPWYMRNWVRTGNPFYSLDVAGLFPVNSVHAGVIAYYRERFGLSTISQVQWASVAWQVARGAPAVILLGGLGICLARGRAAACAAAVLLVALLWIWSIPFTAGGLQYSVRVLSPAWVALAIAAGCCAREDHIWQKRWPLMRDGALAILFLAGTHAALVCWATPVSPRQLPAAALQKREYPQEMLAAPLRSIQTLTDARLPAGGILTDDCYLATALAHNTLFRPVMVWSPEVSDVFDKNLAPANVRERLRAANIYYVSINADNLGFLQQFPFYAQDYKQWRPVRETMNSQVMFFLPP